MSNVYVSDLVVPRTARNKRIYATATVSGSSTVSGGGTVSLDWVSVTADLVTINRALTVEGIVTATGGNSTNWNTAYTHSGTITGSVHGSTTVGGNLFRLTNPSAITFLRINADNTVSALSAANFRTAIGGGTVTSVAMTVPTGLTVSGTPITSSGTLALTLTTGYSIPTTANQTNWTTAYNKTVPFTVAADKVTIDRDLHVTGTITASEDVIAWWATAVGSDVLANLTAAAPLRKSTASNIVLDYDSTTLGINGSNQLYVKAGSGVGSVTSVGLSAPTGFTVTGSPVTSSGTLALAFATGYSLPTTASQTNWNSAYSFTSGFATNYPDLIAIEALAGTSGFLKKTGANTWTLDTNTYLTAITKAQVEAVLTGNITSHTHSYLPLSGGTLTGALRVKNIGTHNTIVQNSSTEGEYLFGGSTTDGGAIESYVRVGITNFQYYNGTTAYNIWHAGNSNLTSVNWSANVMNALQYNLNGANINTVGTLSNVAYKNQDNSFSTTQTIATYAVVTVESSNANYRNSIDTAATVISGGTSSGVGANIVLYGSTHATNPSYINIRQSGTSRLFIGLNGFTGIGYTADPTSGNKLAVNGATYINGNISAQIATLTGCNSQSFIVKNSGGTTQWTISYNTSTNALEFKNASGVLEAVLTQAGNLSAKGEVTAYATI